MSKSPPWGLFPSPIMAPTSVPANAPIGTLIGIIRTSVPGLTLSVVSGPGAINASTHALTLTAAAGAAGSTQTIRIRASRAAPYLQVDQDVVIKAAAAAVQGGSSGQPIGLLLSLTYP